VPLRPSHSCSTTPVWNICKPSIGSPHQGLTFVFHFRDKTKNFLAISRGTGMTPLGELRATVVVYCASREPNPSYNREEKSGKASRESETRNRRSRAEVQRCMKKALMLQPSAEPSIRRRMFGNAKVKNSSALMLDHQEHE
jgi:hypothetical protein